MKTTNKYSISSMTICPQSRQPPLLRRRTKRSPQNQHTQLKCLLPWRHHTNARPTPQTIYAYVHISKARSSVDHVVSNVKANPVLFHVRNQPIVSICVQFVKFAQKIMYSVTAWVWRTLRRRMPCMHKISSSARVVRPSRK